MENQTLTHRGRGTPYYVFLPEVNTTSGRKTQCLNSDFFDTLPNGIIAKILTLMPIRDALRTSILSKKWRYAWRGMPKLVFTNNMVQVPSTCGFGRQLKKYKLVNAIYHVLLSHYGPSELEFNWSVGRDHIHMDAEFFPIISYLARGNRVKALVFRYMNLSPHILQQFLSKCPLLNYVYLIGYQESVGFVAGGKKFTFVDLFRCVPLIVTLGISKYYMKYLSAGGMPHKLPTSLNLKCMYLDVCLMEQNEISSVLCIIRSSPVLKNIIFQMYDNEKTPLQRTPTKFLDLEDDPDLNLVCLASLWIQSFRNLSIEMQFVKLIMAKSPVLEKVKIELAANVSIDEELKMLRDLVLHPIPRASPKAKLAIVRPKTSK